MSYLVFARKWRPQTFDDVVGQEHIATTLKNAIKLNRVSQAYLFAGPRGIGKTSTARILAKALNCKEGPAPSPCNKCTNCLEITASNSLDVIEIDGASNRGIDDIRNLRENVKFSPVNGKYKIYIIDEVHQITDPAFNALLKTLEEPPPHVKFIFATTQPNKIPATILSRCQRFDFRRIPAAKIVEKLTEIAREEKIDSAEGVFFEIAKAADGSMRDAESILDQLNSFCEKKIKIEDVTKVLGVIEDDLLLNLTDLIVRKDLASALKAIEELTNEGRDLFQFLSRFIEHVRNLTILKINRNLSSMLLVPDQMLNRFVSQSENFGLEDLMYFFYLLSNTYEAAKRTGLVRFLLEFALIKAVKREGIVPIDEILEKIKRHEDNKIPQAESSQKYPADKNEAHAVHEPQPNPDNNVAEGAHDLSLADVEKKWQELISSLSQKKASLASFLMGGEPTAVENGVIKIGFPKMHKFHKEILEKAENKKVTEKVFADILGVNVRVEFNLVENLNRKNNFVFQEETPEKKDEDPAIKDALDVFKGSIINNKRFNSNG